MAEEIINKTITIAPDYLKPGIEQYLKMLTQQTGQPMDTSKFAPGVAGIGALQQQAQQLAATQAGLGTLQFDPKTGTATGVSGTGVAGYQPFLQAAAGFSGPQAYKQFESPYQKSVRDETLKQFDQQAAIQQKGISDQAIAAGAFGGGREGIQQAQYKNKSDMDRAMLAAQLNQSGFTQANQLAANAFGQQSNLAQLQPQLAQQGINLASGLGQQDFGYRQAVMDAGQQANRMAAFEPIDRLARFGQGLAGVGGGLGSVQTTYGTPPPQQSPMAGALQAGIGAFSLGKLFGF